MIADRIPGGRRNQDADTLSATAAHDAILRFVRNYDGRTQEITYMTQCVRFTTKDTLRRYTQSLQRERGTYAPPESLDATVGIDMDRYDVIASRAETPDALAEAEELRIEMRRAVCGRRARQVFDLLLDGWPQNAIAAEIGVSESRVGQLVHQIREQARSAVGAR